MRRTYIFILILCVDLYCSCETIVPFIKGCKLNEEDCLLTANMQIAYPYIAEGIPEIDVPTTDPMNFKNITMWTENDNFSFMLPQLKISGGRKCRIVEFRQVPDESSMIFTNDCPMVATGTYKFNGKLFVFNIDKEGEFKMETNSLRTTITAQFDKTVINGKTHWNLLSYEFFSEPRESVKIDLDGLFSGGVEQVEPLMNIINKDWKTIWQIGQPIDGGIVKKVFIALKAFFIRVPIDDFMQC